MKKPSWSVSKIYTTKTATLTPNIRQKMHMLQAKIKSIS